MKYREENEALAFEGSRGNIVVERLQKLSEALTQAQFESIESKFSYDLIKEIARDPNKLQDYITSQNTNIVSTTTL